METMSRSTLVIAFAGLTGFAATQAMATPSASDKIFAEKAAAGGMAEVQLGQLAQQKATSPQIKQFGQRMVTDHSQANQDLQQIAKQENLTLPTQPDSKDRATEQRLNGMSGSAFDTAYSQDMISDHEQDIAAFREEAQSGEDPALKGFAQKYLPVLQQHLQMAQAIEKK
jgi:putative membrane protein